MVESICGSISYANCYVKWHYYVCTFRANIVGGLTSFNENSYLHYALAIIAGFSQNLIPNLANKGEELVTKK